MKSMTREEAAHILEYSRIVSENFTQEAVTATYVMALAALRGPTREMAERMRGEWIEDEFAISHCSLCGYEQEEPELITPFCPLCGSPMTDEAVDMMMRRLEAVTGHAD